MRQADVIVIEGAKSFYRERDGGDCCRMRRGEKTLCSGGRGGGWILAKKEDIAIF